MTNRQIPNGQCTLDPSCLATKNTTSGFVDFGNTRLKENGLFYLCAIVHQTRHINYITVCSDGFLIDESLPEKGVVVVESTNGYLIEGSEMTLRWSGFYGNRKAEITGYPSDIVHYRYAVGMYIHAFVSFMRKHFFTKTFDWPRDFSSGRHDIIHEIVPHFIPLNSITGVAALRQKRICLHNLWTKPNKEITVIGRHEINITDKTSSKHCYSVQVEGSIFVSSGAIPNPSPRTLLC